jgi:hypothetical protein
MSALSRAAALPARLLHHPQSHAEQQHEAHDAGGAEISRTERQGSEHAQQQHERVSDGAQQQRERMRARVAGEHVRAVRCEPVVCFGLREPLGTRAQRCVDACLVQRSTAREELRCLRRAACGRVRGEQRSRQHRAVVGVPRHGRGRYGVRLWLDLSRGGGWV